MTLFQQHCQRWANGCGSRICKTATNIVFARGSIPCDVLMTGEAPGESENVLGKPFCGPAGKLLDRIVESAIEMVGRLMDKSFTFGYCNLVCCIPREENGTNKATEPDDADIISCAPRLIEFVKIANPKLIVCVGALAMDWLAPGYKNSIKFHRDIKRIDIVHPAAILRMNLSMRGLAIQRCVVTISNAIEEI